MHNIVVGRSKSDLQKWGQKGTILLGKQYVKMGQDISLSNDVYLDIAKSHVVFVCGKRGGGKCLTGDTLITLGDGRLVRIDELEHDDAQVMSLNEEYKIQSYSKSHFIQGR